MKNCNYRIVKFFGWLFGKIASFSLERLLKPSLKYCIHALSLLLGAILSWRITMGHFSDINSYWILIIAISKIIGFFILCAILLDAINSWKGFEKKFSERFSIPENRIFLVFIAEHIFALGMIYFILAN